jgi:hypothetical protein
MLVNLGVCSSFGVDDSLGEPWNHGIATVRSYCISVQIWREV